MCRSSPGLLAPLRVGEPESSLDNFSTLAHSEHGAERSKQISNAPLNLPRVPRDERVRRVLTDDLILSLDEWVGGLTVSADRQTVVYSQRTYQSREVMLIDHFR